MARVSKKVSAAQREAENAPKDIGARPREQRINKF